MVWALAKVNSSFSLFKGKDTVESYLLFSNPQEYGKSIDIRFTPIRVVCNNTLTLSLAQKSDMTVRLSHRKKFDADMAKATLGIAQTKLDQYRDAAQFLSSKNYKADSVVKYFRELYPITGKKASEKTDQMSRPAKTAYDLLHTQPGHEYGEGTWWQALNAVTYATDHIYGHNADTRLTSSWYGLNRTKKIEALKKAIEYANAA